MDVLVILGIALRHANTLNYLLQHKQQDFEKSLILSFQVIVKPWSFKSAGELREKLLGLERHIYFHQQTSRKSLDKIFTKDDFFVISQSLKAVKVYLYSLVNISSSFFTVDDDTAAIIQADLGELKERV